MATKTAKPSIAAMLEAQRVVLWGIPVTKEEKSEVYEFVKRLPPRSDGARNKPATWARELILSTVRKGKKGA